ncbi:MAG TPA: permease-like cell division protein FtsX [Thermoanaerobaculia bacterium]|nr:permease-like cell division protein FtsX [Thermoanaerobaculia bacterium]
MNLLQALRYFFREALVNLGRGFRVSVLAILTIAVSLTLGGVFLLASRNLSGAVERWRAETRVVIYLKPDTPPAEVERLAAEARQAAGVRSVQPVSAAAARQRFRDLFPSLSGLVEGLGQEPLPASLEVALAETPGGKALPKDLAAWLDGWRRRPEVSMVDDDREWLRQVETLVAVVRGVGLALGLVLLGAAIFTIASVIRLTAYLHHEEISILRLVGATEFFIRGPFYVEGLLQGVLGAGIAVAGLYGAYHLVHARATASLLAAMLATDFLGGRQIAFVILLGAAAGLLGAVASLRRESL